ncbi:MAG: bifunctional aconitate hydratase 2/2-methylisocitrate dehydratase [Desulfobacteraceae bacterium]|nr:bifunctional aconitate hydratase 2/2-methylisocitrate dehydratase [Desulfobacteraceae bacterium]MBC2754031.1 bifunctional aconitate hydratase 2/2-methylisocitrate dehydratase [Desulfobacteraceae bacterium]
MINAYLKHKMEREAQGIPPKPLTEQQVEELTHLLQNPAGVDESLLLELITHRVPAGVDEAAEVKACFLNDIAKNRCRSPLISPQKAVFLLSTMGGGYNIAPLIDLLDDTDLAPDAANALSKLILIFDAFDEIFQKSKTNSFARQVIDAWADARWFTEKPTLPEMLTFTVFKVEGEINTDDFSPASEAWSRPDIPLHALSMLSSRTPDNTVETIKNLKLKGLPIAFVGDVVGTGSSRKSAANSVIWHIGEDIPCIPNKRRGGVVIGSTIAPIFFNSLEDAGALPIECDVSRIKHGDTITILTHKNRIVSANNGADNGEELARFQLKTNVIVDEVRADGRIPLIIGRTLTDRTRKALDLDLSDVFQRPASQPETAHGFTRAQKIVGRACGLPGIHPGIYCEPQMTTVGSQDTTGPMTRDEIKELACLKFSADLVMQSFCHTAAYPKAVDIKMQNSLHEFIKNRGGVALLPGDGIIHAWLNRMLLPDTVGTGGDSHTRFPIGISFPAGSGLIAFAAALGFMPLDMPESVIVKFTGELQPGITMRDVVNAVPYAAIQNGLLTVQKEGKKNIFAGRIIEFEGWPELSVAQAYELTNASAERSAAAATIDLSTDAVAAFLKDNIDVLKGLIAAGYGDADTIAHRVDKMEHWLESPELLRRDADARYAAEVEVNLSDIKEPILACPNDPDDVRLLSDVSGTPIDEVFIGSCMTGISHFHQAAEILEGKKNLPARLWMTPPTRIDAQHLKNDGLFSVFGATGARLETPGCSLCMGNQARVADGTTVMSTSTRNFPNRVGDNTSVYLGSAQLASVCAILGKIPTIEEYMGYVKVEGRR